MAANDYQITNSKRTVLYERGRKVSKLLPYSILEIGGATFIEPNPYASREAPEGDGSDGFTISGIGTADEESYVQRSLGMNSEGTQVHNSGWI